MNQSTHENFNRDEAASPGSDRTFGLVMAAALALIGAINFHHSGRLWRGELVLAALFLVASLAKPSMLHPLNRPWTKRCLVLHRSVNPSVMGLLFYATIWPTGRVMRMRG